MSGSDPKKEENCAKIMGDILQGYTNAVKEPAETFRETIVQFYLEAMIGMQAIGPDILD